MRNDAEVHAPQHHVLCVPLECPLGILEAHFHRTHDHDSRYLSVQADSSEKCLGTFVPMAERDPVAKFRACQVPPCPP